MANKLCIILVSIFLVLINLIGVKGQDIELSYPLGGEQFENGDTCLVHWICYDSTLATVDILLWDCQSKSWDTLATSVNAQDGIYNWPIPTNTEQYDFRLKLCYNGGSDYSISRGYFQIAIDEPVVSDITEINLPDGISIYPMPAQDNLNILSNGPGIKHINIYDFAMKQVLEYSYHDITNTAIDIAGLANGLYYIILTYSDNTKSFKNFVKF